MLKSVLLVHPVDKKIADHLQETKGKSVCAVYDLAIYPVTFDFVVLSIPVDIGPAGTKIVGKWPK